MNAHRESAGCSSLAWHNATGDVAQAHSQDMVDRNFFSHTNPDGESPFDRLAEAGVEWQGMAGENIALTQGGASSALSLWLSSSGHRANIELCAYTHHGVGLA
ncbi:MAG: CAP domain-containing protein, partial [Planctomycetota bacterium]